MSFRRVQSIHDRSLQNGSPVHASPLSTSSPQAFFVPTQPEASPTFSFLSPRQTPLEKSRPKGHFWRKPFFHFFLCFILGFGIGLTPLSKKDFITAPEVGNKRAAREEFTQGFGSDIEPGPNNSSNGIRLKETDTSNIHPDESSTLVPRKLLLIITPTYTRPFQALYLTRLAHTLKLVPAPLLWLVVESPVQSLETAAVLRKTGVMYRHLVCGKNLTNLKDRGVHQRNIALMHIEKHQLDGIVYFADDDNVYSLELFDQLREIKRFGTWPVGMLAQSKSKAILEGPVCEGNTVIGWHTNEKSKRLRRFHVDMSGFGFNSTILWDPRRWRRPNLDPIRQLDTVKEGFQETTFIEQLVEDESQMEGLPSNCLKIMVWHLHLEAQNLDYPSGWRLEKSLEPTVHI